MTLEHKDVIRCNDEYVCTACGKSWDVADREPPECDAVRHQSAFVRNVQNLATPPNEQQVAAALEQWRKDNPGVVIAVADLAKGGQIDAPADFLFGEGGSDRVVCKSSPTGRTEGNIQAELYSQALKGVGITRGVTRHKRLQGDNLPRGCLRNMDFTELEARALQQASIGWPTPASPLSAWLVFDAEDPKKALLVYAQTGKSAVTFVNQVLKLHGTLTAARCQDMDGEARGFAPYVDANPRNRSRAAKMSRRRIVSLLDWQR